MANKSSAHDPALEVPAAPCVVLEPDVVKTILDNLRDLREAVIGNQLGNPGLIKRVETLETDHKAVNQKLLIWGGIVTGIGFTLQWIRGLFK